MRLQGPSFGGQEKKPTEVAFAPRRVRYSLATLAALGTLGATGYGINRAADAPPTIPAITRLAAEVQAPDNTAVQKDLMALYQTSQLANYDSMMSGRIANVAERAAALKNTQRVKENILEMALLTEVNSDLPERTAQLAKTLKDNKTIQPLSESYQTLIAKSKSQIEANQARIMVLAKSVLIGDAEIQEITKAAKTQMTHTPAVRQAFNTYRLALNLAIDASQKSVMAGQHAAGESNKNAVLQVLSETAVLQKLAQKLPEQFPATPGTDAPILKPFQEKTQKALTQVTASLNAIKLEAQRIGIADEVINQTIQAAQLPTEPTALSAPIAGTRNR